MKDNSKQKKYTSKHSIRVPIVLALLVMLSVPSVYIALSYQFFSSALQMKADLSAEKISNFINNNQNLWMYMEHRLAAELPRVKVLGDHKEQRHIEGLQGEILFQDEEPVNSPMIMKQSEIYEAGQVVGYFQICMTIRHIFVDLLFFIIVGIILGTLVFYAITKPLKFLKTTLDSLFIQRERLFTTLSSIGDGVIATDASGNVVLFNKSIEKITGYSAHEVTGKNLNNFMFQLLTNTSEKRKDLFKRASWTKDIVSIYEDIKLTAKDRTLKNVAITGAPILGKDLSRTGVIFTLKDISRQILAEKESRKIEQLQTLGVFAGGLAHDFNNLLTTINNCASNILIGTEASNSHKNLLHRVQNAVIEAQKLTAQLLTFAKGGAPIFTITSIGELVKRSADLVLRGSQTALVFDISDDLWPAKVDSGQIAQVIQNLVINAQQAMGSGSHKITINCSNAGRIEILEDPRISDDDFIKISISDEGSGISEESKKFIFDPYFTSKDSGSGLGLTICYSIIKKHNGNIFFDTTENEGTTFTILLPASPYTAFKKPPKKITQLIKGTGRILIMDDDIELLESVSEILRELGYRVLTAHHGEEAIECYIESIKNNKQIDLVILDLTVPGKMGGKKTIVKLKELDPSVKAVVSSGYSDDLHLKNFKEHGFDAILSKPYQVYDLSKVVHDLIASGTAGQAFLQNSSELPIEKQNDSISKDLSPQIAEHTHLDIRNEFCGTEPSPESQVGQTYYIAKAELALSTLHNIRNVLTPIFCTLQKLRTNIDEIDLSNCNKVKSEFSNPDLNEDKREQLVQYILLSFEQFSNQLNELDKTADNFTYNINRINGIIEEQDKFLRQKKIISQFNIESLINDSISLFESKFYENISIQLDPEIAKLGTIQGQQLVLVQIFHKIIKNAIESIKNNNTEQGLIIISAALELKESKEMIHLQIRDNGAGINKNHLDKIFDPEFSTKDEHGRGKGLHFCAMCISALEGKIFANSAGAGQGANFHIVFPNMI